jgi:hypothetical protein
MPLTALAVGPLVAATPTAAPAPPGLPVTPGWPIGLAAVPLSPVIVPIRR